MPRFCLNCSKELAVQAKREYCTKCRHFDPNRKIVVKEAVKNYRNSLKKIFE